MLIFLWTPTHFGSLAIVYRDDDRRAAVSMLPACTTLEHSAGWVFLHTIATGSTALGAHPELGFPYPSVALPATTHLLWRSYRLLSTPGAGEARSLLMASNTYLALILAAICIDAMLVIG